MNSTFTITLKKTGTMQFTTTFDKDYPELITDEPVKFGGDDQFPNASRILTAAVASCLAASLSLCLNKIKTPTVPDRNLSFIITFLLRSTIYPCLLPAAYYLLLTVFRQLPFTIPNTRCHRWPVSRTGFLYR